jgi:hypothetical protein
LNFWCISLMVPSSIDLQSLFFPWSSFLNSLLNFLSRLVFISLNSLLTISTVYEWIWV